MGGHEEGGKRFRKKKGRVEGDGLHQKTVVPTKNETKKTRVKGRGKPGKKS